MSPSPRPILLPLAVCLAVSACRLDGDPVTVDDLIDEARYTEALDLSLAELDARPDDPAAHADYERAHLASLLDLGRELTFADRHLEALALFREAAELAPQATAPRLWIRKSKDELAREHRLAAFAAEGAGEHMQAIEQYTRALFYDPEDDLASAGIERVRDIAGYRAEQAGDYYRQGVRSLRRFQIPEALRSFQATLKYAPDDAAGAARREEVEVLVADERQRIGAELESQGLLRGALLEYRLAREYAPDSQDIATDIARMEREVEVLEVLDEAERLLLRGDFDGAFELYDDAAGRTELLAERVASARTLAESQQLDSLYARALELEEDFQYPAAIEAYDDLLTRTGGFYLDAIARRDTLADHVEVAGRLYDQARQATDREERARYLRQIELIWPTYRDVSEQLDRLEARGSGTTFGTTTGR